jgi:[acyl-carrier-protein] S-malonyltransferase
VYGMFAVMPNGNGQLAMLFPGQGSQTADMRDQVERQRPDLLELARAEVAGYAVLRQRYEVDLMAGHSLGEITALVAADAIDAEDGLRLVAARGRLMQEAAEETGDGGMTAVRARDRAAVEEVAAEAGVAIANDNAPDQLVLSGALAALDQAERLLAERKVRAKRLPVAGAFHSPLMVPAVEPFRDLVQRIDVREPRVPVLSCVTAAPFDDVRDQLVQALTHPVRWTDVMGALHDLGASHFVETGPGRVLTNLVRKSLDGVEAEAPLAMEAANA